MIRTRILKQSNNPNGLALTNCATELKEAKVSESNNVLKESDYQCIKAVESVVPLVISLCQANNISCEELVAWQTKYTESLQKRQTAREKLTNLCNEKVTW